MAFIKHQLGSMIDVSPKAAAKAILNAYTKAKCNQRDASKILGIHEGTFGSYVRRLELRAELDSIRERAQTEGWLHAKGRMGGRPKKSVAA